MVIINKCLNCRDKEYEFNLSVITDDDCKRFAFDYIISSNQMLNNYQVNGIKVIIRDNKAKIVLYYQCGGAIHEVKLILDVFGNKSQNYQDNISKIWQEIMIKHHGDKYKQKLDSIINEFEQKLDCNI